MADELSETAGGATKGLLGTVGFILILLGGEILVDKSGERLFLGLWLVAAGAPIFFVGVFWRWIQQWIASGIARKVNWISTDPMWWVAIFSVFTTFSLNQLGLAATMLWLAPLGVGYAIYSWRKAGKKHLEAPSEPVLLQSPQNADLERLLSGLQDRIESDRKQTEQKIQLLCRALRARDAEFIIKEADKTVRSVVFNLLEKPYPDEAAWTAHYDLWKGSMSQIDSVMLRWQDHHKPYLDIRLKDLEGGGAPAPPLESNIKSDIGRTRYKTVWLAQQSYANQRENILLYFYNKAGELPELS